MKHLQVAFLGVVLSLIFASNLAYGQTDLQMIAHWDFNETDGTILHDISENGHDGEINGATRDQENPGTLYFDGTDYVKIDPSPLFNDLGKPNTSWSYEVIFSTTYVPPGNPEATLLSNYHSVSGDDPQFSLSLHEGHTGRMYGSIRSNGSYEVAPVSDPDINWADDEYHHLVWVADAEQGKLFLYIDQELADEEDYDSTRDFSDDGELYIGALFWRGSYFAYYTGYIDEIKIYKGAFHGQPQTGTIAGTVTMDGNGFAGVTVKLLDGADPTIVVEETDTQGGYSFTDVLAGDYQVMIVEPLGYSADRNDVQVTLAGGATETVDFVLTAYVTVNEARGKGYWKHQFDVYVKEKGNAQESETDLQSYIDEVRNRYNIHFDVLDGMNDFAAWQVALSVKGNAGMLAKAKAHLAALAMNVMSLKVAQYEVVTEDGYTASDVLTYVSELIEDVDGSNDELAKNLAEQVNSQQTIAAGLVDPLLTILYKAGAPTAFALKTAVPNPFNPSTQIAYEVPRQAHITLIVHNLLGQEVVRLVDQTHAPGRYNVTWNGRNTVGLGVASGVYVYRMTAGDYTESKRMTLVK